MGCVNSTLKQKKLKRSIDSKKNIDSESDKNIINPIEEDYDSDDSIDRLSIDDFVEEYVRREEYGTCTVCNRFNTNYDWCHTCDIEKLIQGWDSGDKIIDEFIRKTQKKAGYYTDSYLEWIPFESIAYLQTIGQEGSNPIYSAIWLDGEREYKKYFYPWVKGRSPPIKVTLKILPSSINKARDLLNELKTHYKNAKSSDPISFYGITYVEQIEKFMIVIEHFDYGDLRTYLKSNFSDLKWKTKINLLDSTARGLSKLHYFEKSIHKDLHTGNILQSIDINEDGSETIRLKIYKSFISSKKKTNGENQKIFGVLPYIAPEIFVGQNYSEVVDVYGFGMIMVEMSKGNPPFHDHPHSLGLANKICKGDRPKCAEGTPKCYVELVENCLNSDPEKRPTMNSVLREISSWKDTFVDDVSELSNEQLEIRKSFEAADKFIPEIAANAYSNTHPKSAWKSKYLILPRIPDSQNEDLDDIILFENDEDHEDHDHDHDHDHNHNSHCSIQKAQDSKT